MNPESVVAAAPSLLRFKDKVDLAKPGEPSFLAVVTTRSAALRRPGGIQVIPIASLCPYRRGITSCARSSNRARFATPRQAARRVIAQHLSLARCRSNHGAS